MNYRKQRMSDADFQAALAKFWEEKWSEVREMARGRWGSILPGLASALGPACDHQGKRHVPCPVHGGKDGYRVFKDFAETGRSICNTCGNFHDGFATLQWVNGWTARESLEEVYEFLTDKKLPAFSPSMATSTERAPIRRALVPVAVSKPHADNEQLKKSLNKTWQSTLSLADPKAEPARLYLARRGLSIPQLSAVRFHPNLAYHNGEEVTGFHPALIAMVQAPDGTPVTLHRTYLDASGNKAAVESVKKMMSYPDDRQVLGSSIRLAKVDTILGVAEGLETALAAMEATGIPVWPTVNARMLEYFTPPPSVQTLIVFADKDRPSKQHPRGHGQEASLRLVKRMWELGIKASAITPKGEIPEGDKSIDWLDVFVREGVSGFPSLTSIRLAMAKAA